MAGGARNAMATIIGWVIVAVVLYIGLNALMATIGFLLRFLIWAIVVGALVTLYLNLRRPSG